MTKWAPGTDLSGIDTMTGLPIGQSRPKRRPSRRRTVKGSRPRPPMVGPRPPRPSWGGPRPPRPSWGGPSVELPYENRSPRGGGRNHRALPPGYRPYIGPKHGRIKDPSGHQPRLIEGSRPSSDYGGRIGAPPGTMFTMDFKDSDRDGVDDRHQPGPGMPDPRWEGKKPTPKPAPKPRQEQKNMAPLVREVMDIASRRKKRRFDPTFHPYK